jgi:uncharacterized protein
VAKIILVVLGLMLAWWILKGYRRRVDRRDGAPSRPAEAESMVQCAQCGVHLPRSESLLTQGLYFCCADHRRQHEAGRDAK